eukprot:6213419-Pleurochrysis_carterae.AAC.4
MLRLSLACDARGRRGRGGSSLRRTRFARPRAARRAWRGGRSRIVRRPLRCACRSSAAPGR